MDTIPDKQNQIEITTNIGCRVQCKFCPQDVSMPNYAKKNDIEEIKFGNPVIMPYATFVKIIEKVPKNVTIRFSGFSEPFLNPDCGKMMKYASDNGYYIELFSTLMGMTLEDVDILKKINLKHFVIHLADNEKYAKIALKQHNEILKKIISLSIENIFFMTMGTISDETKNIIGMDVKPSVMVDWAGHTEFGEKTKRISGPIVCSMNPSKKNQDIPPIILPNGDALLCCKDWSMDYVLGNLINCNYEDLFQSKTYKEIVRKMSSENENILCRNCEFAVSVNAQNELEKQYAELKINPNDNIAIKLNSLYEKYLLRQIDPEGLIFFYKQIQNMHIDYNDVEKQIQNSPEYASQLKKYRP
tara:strand:- start:6304 stop:7377 length:1074 start_codon:yes stop_codon:yes gene_type:complete